MIDLICSISFVFWNLGMHSVYLKDMKSALEVTV